MDRRNVLTTVGAISVGSFAGCLGGGSDDTDDSTSQSDLTQMTEFGESVTKDGVVVTVKEYKLIDSYYEYPRRHDPFERSEEDTQDFLATVNENDYQYPPTPGGVFLFLNVTIKNEADGRRTFPDPDEMQLKYGDETSNQFTSRYPVLADGENYRLLGAVISADNMARSGVYTGVAVDGWLIFQVPEQFNEETVRFEMSWEGETEVWSPVVPELEENNEDSSDASEE